MSLQSSNSYKSIPEYTKLDSQQFFEHIVPLHKPVVIREFVSNWPIVRSATQTPQDFANYLLAFYRGNKTTMVVAPPAAKKRFFYNEAMNGVNFVSGEERLDLFLGRLLELIDREIYPAVSMQSTPLNSILPGLAAENKTDFFSSIEPRLWLGNEGIVNTHYDGADNLACVVAGRRRFVLFPPEQTSNLYPGPLNFTPAGAPTSLVNLAEPDFEKYPQFSVALDHAYSAELGPGDAIFIPMLWWHHVESLSKVNGLMNYWWNGSSAPKAVSPSPIDSLNINILAMRDLNSNQRDAWRAVFDHYVFHTGVAPCSYLPKDKQQILGELSPAQVRMVKDYLINKLQN